MASISDGSHVLGERLKAMPGDKPRGFHIILCEELQDPLDADGPREVA